LIWERQIEREEEREREREEVGWRWKGVHTIRFIVVAVYIHGNDTPDLIAHVVDSCGNGSGPDALGIAGSHPDKNGVGIGDAVDTSQ
jgi:hypothetical protein